MLRDDWYTNDERSAGRFERDHGPEYPNDRPATLREAREDERDPDDD